MKNIKDIAERVAEKHNKDKNEVLELLKTTFKIIEGMIVEEESDVRIKNFGVFENGKLKGRRIKHPKTHEEMTTNEKKVIKFRAANSIKRNLNSVA